MLNTINIFGFTGQFIFTSKGLYQILQFRLLLYQNAEFRIACCFQILNAWYVHNKLLCANLALPANLLRHAYRHLPATSVGCGGLAVVPTERIAARRETC